MVVGVMGLAMEAGIARCVARFFGVDAVNGIFAFGDEWNELQSFFLLERRLKAVEVFRDF